MSPRVVKTNAPLVVEPASTELITKNKRLKQTTATETITTSTDDELLVSSIDSQVKRHSTTGRTNPLALPESNNTVQENEVDTKTVKDLLKDIFFQNKVIIKRMKDYENIATVNRHTNTQPSILPPNSDTQAITAKHMWKLAPIDLRTRLTDNKDDELEKIDYASFGAIDGVVWENINRWKKYIQSIFVRYKTSRLHRQSHK